MIARRALKRNHARAARETEALLGAADEAVRHADLWRTYGAEGRIRAHVASLGRTIIATSARLRSRSALLSGTSEVLGALALVLTLALASAGAIGGVDRGVIVPFAIAFFMAYKPLRELVEARLVRTRAEEILTTTPVPLPPALPLSLSLPPALPLPLPLPPANGRSPPSPLTNLVGLHGTHAPLTLHVPAGQIAAIVGPTGIGKTSLLRALLGLDPALAGSVTWGDDSLTGRGVGPRERPFAWVPQDARSSATPSSRTSRSVAQAAKTTRRRTVCILHESSTPSAQQASPRRSATPSSRPNAASPAASVSGSPWLVRSPRSFRSCSSTSPRARSTAPRRSECSRPSPAFAASARS